MRIKLIYSRVLEYSIRDSPYMHEMQRVNRLACMLVQLYELLASCLEGATGSQICQSGAAMPDRLAPLLATNHLASATVIKFSLQN